MQRPLVVTGLAAAVLVLGASMAAAQTPRACPHEESQREAIAATLKAASSCSVAYDLMNACRSNTSGDVELAEIVIERCEPMFLASLSAAAKGAYDRERQACVSRYPRSGGTMNVSFAATCQAGVAARYSRDAAKRSRAK